MQLQLVFRNDSTTPKTPGEEEKSPSEQGERSPKDPEEVGVRAT